MRSRPPNRTNAAFCAGRGSLKDGSPVAETIRIARRMDRDDLAGPIFG